MERATRRLKTLAATFAIVAAFGAVAAPTASAAFGLSNVTAAPANTNAGANSDLTIGLDVVEPNRDLKKLVVHLPPGLVGNPLATPTCTEVQLNADACPTTSDVGDVSNEISLTVLPPLPAVPFTVSGDVYNVVPRKGEPARFGFVLRPVGTIPVIGGVLAPIVLQSPASLRPDDLGLDTTLDNIPNTANGLALDINSIDLTLRGQVGAPPQGFLRNPTSCGVNTVGFDATSYDGMAASAQSTFTTTNCEALQFSPKFSAAIKQSGSLTNGVEVSTTISQTIQEAGLKRAVVTLPGELSPNQAALLNQCPDASFQAGTCPANTKVGSARAASPLQASPLTGDVFVVASTSGGIFPEIGVDLRGSLALKLKGGIALTPDLRAIVTFDGLPDIPISEFTLAFAGGPAGLSAAKRNLCTPPAPVFDTIFLAHSAATSTLATPATVDCTGFDDGGGGGGNAKKPVASIKVGKLGSEEPTLKLKVKAGASRLTKAKLKLPKGLSFAGGAAFERGSSAKGDGRKLPGKAIKHGRSSLTLKAKGAKSLKAAVGGGALVARGKLGSAKKLRFGLKLVDAAGRRTALTVRPK